MRIFKRAATAIMNAAFAIGLITGAQLGTVAAEAGEKAHRVAIHIDDNDPKRMNLVLNNIQNMKKYYDSKKQKVTIELVAYGPGLHMLRADTSPVKERIATMALGIDNLQFSACGNTHAKMSKKAGKKVVLLSEATKVPSGVIRLIELQEQGYAYIRP